MVFRSLFLTMFNFKNIFFGVELAINRITAIFNAVVSVGNVAKPLICKILNTVDKLFPFF